MAEVAGLVLGVAPLCLEAIKGLKWVSVKVLAYRRYSNELGRLQNKLAVQMELFKAECEFMLTDGIDGNMVADMLDNVNHEAWQSEELEPQLRAHLGLKYRSYKGFLEEINEIIEDLGKAFGELENCKESEEDHKSAIKHRIKAGLMVAFNVSKFKEDIATLGELNSLLRQMREIAAKKKSSNKRLKALPKGFREVRRCTISLRGVLSQEWSCEDASHVHHSLSLLVDPIIGADIRFKAILENKASVPGIFVNGRATPLTIECKDMTWVAVGSDATRGDEGRRYVQRLAKRPKTKRRQDKPSEALEPQRSEPTTTSEARSAPQATSSLVDLSLCKDMCSHVSAPDRLVGYLESPDRYRYVIGSWDTQSLESMTQGPKFEALPLSRVLEQSLQGDVSVIDQLELALVLAKATLQFWSTPWWTDFWSMTDLKFDQNARSLSECVKTVHIRMDLVLAPEAQKAWRPNPTRASPIDEELQKAVLLFGVRNINLHCLGVALLQIGRWTCVEAGDIEQVRRLSKLPSQLGPRYRAITEKCLGCDFGVGDDLKNSRLQAAIYDSVVRELEKMIEALKIEDEESL